MINEMFKIDNKFFFRKGIPHFNFKKLKSETFLL